MIWYQNIARDASVTRDVEPSRDFDPPERPPVGLLDQVAVSVTLVVMSAREGTATCVTRVESAVLAVFGAVGVFLFGDAYL